MNRSDYDAGENEQQEEQQVTPLPRLADFEYAQAEHPCPDDATDLHEIETYFCSPVVSVAPALIVIFEVGAPLRTQINGREEMGELEALDVALSNSPVGEKLLEAIHCNPEFKRAEAWGIKLDQTI